MIVYDLTVERMEQCDYRVEFTPWTLENCSQVQQWLARVTCVWVSTLHLLHLRGRNVPIARTLIWHYTYTIVIRSGGDLVSYCKFKWLYERSYISQVMGITIFMCPRERLSVSFIINISCLRLNTISNDIRKGNHCNGYASALLACSSRAPQRAHPFLVSLITTWCPRYPSLTSLSEPSCEVSLWDWLWIFFSELVFSSSLDL